MMFASRQISMLGSVKAFVFSLWYLCYALTDIHQHRPNTDVPNLISVPLSFYVNDLYQPQTNKKAHIIWASNYSTIYH
jgi:hypothetical protein